MSLRFNSIEYQLTPVSVSELVSEVYYLGGSRVFKSRWRNPIIAGVAVAVFVFWQNYPFQGVLKIGDTDLSIIADIFSALFVVALGFGMGFGGVLLSRALLISKVRRLAQKELVGSNAPRRVFWDEATLAISSPLWETKVKWEAFEAIIQREYGIYVLMAGKVVFGLPKSALPAGASADDLTALWNSLLSTAKTRTANCELPFPHRVET